MLIILHLTFDFTNEYHQIQNTLKELPMHSVMLVTSIPQNALSLTKVDTDGSFQDRGITKVGNFFFFFFFFNSNNLRGVERFLCKCSLSAVSAWYYRALFPFHSNADLLIDLL